MGCSSCRRFFQQLHRRCTIHLNGECDCPICQGVCSCKRPMTDLEETVFGDSQEMPPRRKFGDPR